MLRSSCCVRYEISGAARPPCFCSFYEGDCSLFVFPDRVSLYSSGCPGTHSVVQDGLELRNLPASASWVLGLHACAITAWWRGIFLCHTTYTAENPEAPEKYMWSYSAVPELNSQHRWMYENLYMDVCNCDWDIGDHNAESKEKEGM